MAITNFIPSVWSAQLLVNLYNTLVFAGTDVVNRNYEGEIKNMGDTVRINAIGSIALSDYVRNADMAAPSALTDAQTVLTIEKAKSFNFAIDDADQAQANVQLMGDAMREAAYAVANNIDTYVAGKYTDAGATVGATGSPKTIAASTDAYDDIVAMGVLLDQNNVPQQGRWLIVPPWLHGVLRKDTRFLQTPDSLALGIKQNAAIGQIANFTVFKSNNVQQDVNNDWKVMAGYNGTITFAEQVAQVEAYRPPLRFADAVKGLFLFGAKVIRPQALCVLTVTRPAGI